MPDLPPNTVLCDYPNERFALDCITEYFFQASDEESDEFMLDLEVTMTSVARIMQDYAENKELYGKYYVSCSESCAGDGYCIQECRRRYCSKECPAAIQLNREIQTYYDNYVDLARRTTDNQRKILNAR